MIANIQVLRAFAALSVVSMHIAVTSSSYGFHSTLFALAIGRGDMGVDIFFVISGFIMVYTQTNTPRTPLEFIRNRIRRIVPIYWLLSLAAILCVLAVPQLLRNNAVEGTRWATSFLFLTTALTEESPTLYVGWTLELEMLFYSVFAASLVLRHQELQPLVAAVALILLVALTDTNHIVLEFIFGMAIGYVIFQVKSIPHAWLWLSAATLFLLSSTEIDYRLERFIQWGIPAAGIVLSVCFMRQVQNRLVQNLGNASYSIYLIQVFTVPAFYKFAQWTSLESFHELLAIACLAFTAFSGKIMYSYVEKPLSVLLSRVEEIKTAN